MKDRILMTSSDDLWRHQYMTSSDVLLACNIILELLFLPCRWSVEISSTLNLWRDDVIITLRDDSAFNLTQCSSINNAHMPLYIFMFIYFIIRWPKEIKSQINQKLKNQKNWNRSKGHRKATRIRQLKHPMFIIITDQVNMDDMSWTSDSNLNHPCYVFAPKLSFLSWLSKTHDVRRKWVLYSHESFPV